MYKEGQVNTGAIQSASVSRKKALDKYYANPNICEWCKQVIPVPDGVKVPIIRKKKFCDRSCAAKHNNQHFPKRQAPPMSVCEECGCDIENKKTSSGAYVRRKYCDICLPTKRLQNQGKIALHSTTKGELYGRLSNRRGRMSICGNARFIYRKSQKPMCCLTCGYSTYVEVCHIKAVSEFPDNTPVSVINDPDNLIALCPTHHWEFDNGHLKIDI